MERMHTAGQIAATVRGHDVRLVLTGLPLLEFNMYYSLQLFETTFKTKFKTWDMALFQRNTATGGSRSPDTADTPKPCGSTCDVDATSASMRCTSVS